MQKSSLHNLSLNIIITLEYQPEYSGMFNMTFHLTIQIKIDIEQIHLHLPLIFHNFTL